MSTKQSCMKMVISTLFTTANNGNSADPPARLYKVCCMHRMQRSSGIKGCICDAIRLDLRTWSDGIHTQKRTCSIVYSIRTQTRTCSIVSSPRTGRTNPCWQKSEDGCWEDCEGEGTACRARKRHGPWFMSCFGSVGSYAGCILPEH